MTPEEKRALLKREMLREAMAQDEEAPAAEAPADTERPAKYSLPEAAARGLADMGSWGTASKIEGAMGAVKDFATEPSLHGWDGLKEAYHVREGLAHDRYKESAEEHPWATIAGGLPGAVMAPGSGLFAPAKAAEGATALARVGTAATNVGKAAGMGATYGAGSSRHNVLEEPKEFATDVGVGGAGGVAGYGAGKLIASGGKLVLRGGGKIGKMLGGHAMLGVPEAEANRYLDRPDQVKNAMEFPERTKAAIDHMDQVKRDLSDRSGHSYATLSDAGTTSHENFISPLTQGAQEISATGAYSADKKKGLQFLNGLVRDAMNDVDESGQISYDRGKNLVTTIRSEAERMKAQPGADGYVLGVLGRTANAIDSHIKDAVPAYRDEMAELARKTDAYAGVADKFRSENGAYNMMKGIARGKRPFEEDALRAFDAENGSAHLEDLKDSYARQAFNQSTTNGSRKVNAWRGIVGGMLGGLGGLMGVSPEVTGPMGIAVGSGAGMAADIYGGKAYMKLLDGSIKLGKFAAPIANAARRGEPALKATHALLMKTSPEYRDLIDSQTQGANQ